MTQQSSDIIIFKDKRFFIDTDLLRDKSNGEFPNEMIETLIRNNHTYCTDCRKGYYASWEIINSKLYLTSLEIVGDDENINLEVLFQEPEFKLETHFNKGKIVLANWVTCELKLIDPNKIGDYEFMVVEDKDCYFFKCNKGILSHSKVRQLISVVLNGVDFIKNEPYENGLTSKGRYEVMLFNSFVVLHEYKNTNPLDFSNDVEEFHNILIHYAKDLYLGLDKNEMLLFFDSRYKFYSKEIDQLTDGSGTYIPGRIYSAFYLTPLVNEPEMIYDFVVLIPFIKTIVNLAKWIYSELPKLEE